MKKLFILCIIGSMLLFMNYTKVQGQSFSEISTSVVSVSNSASDWGDYDNDGDMDLVILGIDTWNNRVTRIYRNNGNGTFTDINAGLVAVSYGDCKWGDLDNDGDLDLFITGCTSGAPYNALYVNQGNGTFSLSGAQFSGLGYSSADLSDYNHDGYLDILCSGYYWPTSSDRTIVYKNNKDGTFAEQTGFNLAGLESGKCEWGDYNNDGYPDILLSGPDGAKIYKNDHIYNRFVLINQFTLPLSYSKAGWGDYTSDGYLDFFHMGRKSDAYGNTLEIYRNNNGFDSFQNTISSPYDVNGVIYGAGAWGDYDNDGDPDLLVTGATWKDPNLSPDPDPLPPGQTYMSRIYKNNGVYSFPPVQNTNFTPVAMGSVNWVDYDNDGDLDVFLTGETQSGEKVSKLYRNNLNVVNTPPTAPTGLSLIYDGEGVFLHWNKATDAQTPQDALTYNIYLFDDASGKNIGAPEAFLPGTPNNGKRLVAKIGRLQYNYQYKLFIPPKNYSWGVQAVDAGFKASPFAFITVKADPVINWNNPVDITYGTPLSSTQLNAIANTPGTFTYSPSAGTVLEAGAWLLNVTFNPADTVHYRSASKTVQINVTTKLNQTITFNPIDQKWMGDPPFNPGATASSGLPVYYKCTNSKVAYYSKGLIYITGVGVTQVIATQSGNNIYNPAPSVIQVLVVGRILPPQDKLSVIENENTFVPEVLIYPNPSKEKITIEATFESAQIEIVDLAGTIIYKTFMQGTRTDVDLTGFKPGVYFVKLFGSNTVKTYKIILTD